MKDKCIERKPPKDRKKYNLKGTLEEYYAAKEQEEDSQIQTLLLSNQRES